MASEVTSHSFDNDSRIDIVGERLGLLRGAAAEPARSVTQYSYWFMAVRSTLDVKRGDLQAIKGLRISAAPAWPEMSLRYMLADAGIDLERDNVRIVPPPPPYGDKGFMARNGVDSIIQNTADAYWGNGMRVALGERLGIAKLHLDLRRGDGPPGARHYNFAALIMTRSSCASVNAIGAMS